MPLSCLHWLGDIIETSGGPLPYDTNPQRLSVLHSPNAESQAWKQHKNFWKCLVRFGNGQNWTANLPDSEHMLPSLERKSMRKKRKEEGEIAQILNVSLPSGQSFKRRIPYIPSSNSSAARRIILSRIMSDGFVALGSASPAFRTLSRCATHKQQSNYSNSKQQQQKTQLLINVPIYIL